jgi:hypothetical protein
MLLLLENPKDILAPISFNALLKACSFDNVAFVFTLSS